MTLHPGLWLHKITSDRDAQIAGLDRNFVWLTWADDTSQTSIKRERLGRTNEWKEATR
jgi:hypothetical protein